MDSSQSNRLTIPHPYARLFAKKDGKRRKIWHHALEKSVFTAYELSTIGAPQRRQMYIASLEAHIDLLHDQFLRLGYWPVDLHDLDPYKGLNSKTAKSMVAGLQHDTAQTKLKILELERTNEGIRKALLGQSNLSPADQPRRLALQFPTVAFNTNQHQQQPHFQYHDHNLIAGSPSFSSASSSEYSATNSPTYLSNSLVYP